MTLQTFILMNPTVTVFQSIPFLFLVGAISLGGGLIWSWPRPISQDYSAPKTKISIVKGNILDEKEHLVIGTNNTFDTETPIIIAQSSLQGQALQALYGGDLEELNGRLDAALERKQPIGTITKAGKQTQYGVGTVATVKQAARLIFFVAYCEMDEHNTAHSTPDKVWMSLLSLWDEVSKKSNGGIVAVPVIGGGQARLSNLLPAQDAIRLTLLSFMFASRREKVCDELRVVVRPQDYEKLDRLELQSFLSSLRSS